MIPAGESVTSIYYSDTQAGAPAVTATDLALGSTATQRQTVMPGPASQIAFTSAPLDIVAGTLGQITIALEDSYGNATTSPSSQTISLSSTSPTGLFYSSPTGATPVASLIIPVGQSTVSFYFDDTAVGTPTITAVDTALGSAPTQQETLMAAPASQVAFTSPVLTLVAGTRGLVTLALEDSSGDPVGAALQQTLSLSTTSPEGLFFATQTSTTPLASVDIAAGQTTISVYYSDTKAGTPTVTASDGAFSSPPPTQEDTVTPAPASQLVFTSAPCR